MNGVTYYITKDGKVVNDREHDVYTMQDRNELLQYSCLDDISISFCGIDYNNINNYKINGDKLAYKLAKEVAKHKDEIIINKDVDYNDVRYAVYWYEPEKKYVSVCIQDFDVKDYTEENFILDKNNETIEFYRAYYGDLDTLAKSLCDIVCKKLNEHRK